ncbi:MAG: fatty acid desaturase [Candidatus Pacebacteria bacterium]|nr:fatty acid desaturase [Candidatus Paceibacterota bacterium]
MNLVQGAFRRELVGVLAMLHFLAAYGVWWCSTWGVPATAWVLAVVLYCVSSLGITVGYHRYFTHGAFWCVREVKYALAIAGALAGEGPLSRWCADHRQHHRFTDGDFDPHSPWSSRAGEGFKQSVLGFLWAHVGWICWETKRPDGFHPGVPVHDAAVVAWQERYYWHIVAAGFLVPFLLAGWAGFFLAGCIRMVAHFHATWMVNSVCHLWGSHPLGPDGDVWKRDKSRNNVFVALVTMGEGWHGNHHVQPHAAQLGYRWYHWDPGKWLIHLFEGAHVARKVQRYTV